MQRADRSVFARVLRQFGGRWGILTEVHFNYLIFLIARRRLHQLAPHHILRLDAHSNGAAHLRLRWQSGCGRGK